MISVIMRPAEAEGDVVYPINLPLAVFSRKECLWNLGRATSRTYQENPRSTWGECCGLLPRSPTSLTTEVLSLPAARGARMPQFSRDMPPGDGVHPRKASRPKVCNLHPMTGWWRFSFSSCLNLRQPVGALPTPQLSIKLSQALFLIVVQISPLSSPPLPQRLLS